VGERNLPPIAVAISFIDCINRGDVAGLGLLMTADHVLQVFDEAPIVGRHENVSAWTGYATSFPSYVIYPHRLAARGGRVAVLGHTTGSHLGLPDLEESALTLIWIAEIESGKVRLWQLVEDRAKNRAELGLELV
jgi:hypothetical protein